MKTAIFFAALFMIASSILMIASSAFAGQLSPANAKHFVEATTVTPEYQERFYSPAEPGFDDVLALFSRKKRMMIENDKVRGITNAAGIVYVAYKDGTYLVVGAAHDVAGWMGQAPSDGINLFEASNS